MKLISPIFFFFIATHCYSQSSSGIESKDALFNKLILGTWKIGNIKFTYFKNGTYTARFSKGSTDHGSWHIQNGVFVIKPEPFGIEREYTIISLDTESFKYQLGDKSIDDSIYVERKIMPK